MSEATDLAVPEGQAEEAPESAEPEFGFDATEDTPDEAPEEQSGQPEDETPQSTEPAEDKAGTLRFADYTKKTQDLADERRALQAERESLRAEMQREREQMYATFQQPQAQNAGLASEFERIAAASQDPNERAGLSVLASMAEKLEALEHENATLKQGYNDLTPQVQQASQAAQALTQAQQNQLLSDLSKQKAEAVEAFGDDTVAAAMPLVGRMAMVNGNWSPEVNPQTNQPYTIPEMVGLVSGKLAAEAQNAQQAQISGSRGAKRTVGQTGVSTGSKPGAFTTQDAINEIAQNQRSFGA